MRAVLTAFSHGLVFDEPQAGSVDDLRRARATRRALMMQLAGGSGGGGGGVRRQARRRRPTRGARRERCAWLRPLWMPT